MTSARLCLVRHGETAWNAERRIQGQLDVPLSAVGRAQARAAAAALATERFDALYASDLARAHETAGACAEALGLPVRSVPGLRERHYGVFQALTYAEMEARHPEEFARFRARDEDFPFSGGGESLRDFAARVNGTVDEILAAHPGGQVLLVTHGGVLDILQRRASRRSLADARDFEIPNAALNWLAVAGDAWSILAWADQSHLAAALDELAG